MHPLSGLAEESEFFEAILKRVTVELNLIVTLNNNIFAHLRGKLPTSPLSV